MSTSLLDLRTRFYNRFDEGATNYISVAEANSLLNEGGEHLHNWIVNEGEYYIWKETPIPMVAGQSDYPLPTDFLKILKVFGTMAYPTVSGSPALRPLDRLMPEEYRGLSMGAFQGPYPAIAQCYMLMGNTLRIMPVPMATTPQIVLWYAPQYTPLVVDTDLTSLSQFAAAEEFIINQAVIAARLKEESDTSQLERRQGAIMSMIQSTMTNRDMGRHQHVVDVDGYCGL
jgi:hypothetical protein